MTKFFIGIVLNFLLINSSVYSQFNINVDHYDEIDFPIYFEGNIKVTNLSDLGDTVNFGKYKHDLLLDRHRDTLSLSVYFNGSPGNALERKTVFKFLLIEEELLFYTPEEFMSFPELGKLFFIKKDAHTSDLNFSVKRYNGNEIEGFGNVDSLFNFFGRSKIQGAKYSSDFSELQNIESPIESTSIFFIGMTESYQVDGEPYYVLRSRPIRIRKFSKLKELKIVPINKGESKKYYVLMKNDEKEVYDLIIEKETKITVTHEGRNRIYKKMIREGIYINKPIDNKVLQKFK